ncbi:MULTISPECIES: hypothetical protein [unclassified Sphingomonas]|uniref:hypothetical protein n=1 Tax=unclassified Sphingomonas TaxID=196159 RepID=UPI00226A32CA|nr:MULTISPECIES: hypothetical protein [unclassified Sphingomonas]
MTDQLTVRDLIISAIETAIAPLAREVEVEPAGDPSVFPGLGITDGGHRVLEREVMITRRAMTVTVDGFVEGGGGKAPTAERNALLAHVVAAIMADETLGGTVELIEDGDLRLFTATLASVRRLGFAQDFTIQFTTSRADPALPA